MKFDKKFDMVILILTLFFILLSIYTSLIYAPLVPTDVSTIAHSSSPSKYIDLDHRVKGIVKDWDGNSTFILTDIGQMYFSQQDKLYVTHTGKIPKGFNDNKTVFVTGVIIDVNNMTFKSKEIEIDDEDPNTPGGWIAPYSQKIFFFHVPAAWVSFVAFGVVFIMSILYLKNSKRKWDTIAFASAEIGVVFCTLAIVTGPIWGKAEWGVYWRWEDTKLTITFVLWLIFVAYLLLRGGVESENKARLAAVFGIIGFACVPLSFISSRVWQSMHPNVVATSEGSMSSETGIGLLIGVIAFTFLYLFLLRKRIFIQELSMKVEDLKEKIGGI